jgi:hypothetical protein
MFYKINVLIVGHECLHFFLFSKQESKALESPMIGSPIHTEEMDHIFNQFNGKIVVVGGGGEGRGIKKAGI